jgi:putative heme-binding domain-containing protein
MLSGGMAMAQDHAAEHHASEPAAGEVTRPRIFFDKAPAIIAYQLKRLSDAELLLVECDTTDAKYLPVYEAILGRSSMAAPSRLAALRAVAKLKQLDLLEVMLGVCSQDESTSDDLLRLLTAEIATRESLHDDAERLLSQIEGFQGAARQLLYAGMIANGKPLGEWQPDDADATSDLLAAMVLVGERAKRADLSQFAAAASESNDSAVVNRALHALATASVDASDSFRRACAALDDAATRGAAINLLLSLPAEAVDKELAGPAVKLLVEAIRATPVEQRIDDKAQATVAAVDKLLPLLEKGEANAIRSELRDLTVEVIRITTVYEEMRYDSPFVVVEAGRKVHLELVNPDAMPHNWLLCQPEQIREVANLAAALSGRADETGRQYVPDSELVIVSTPAAQAGETVTVDFVAPTEPGEYPYVCTFPGHWMRMYGVMLVVEDIEAWRADPQPPADPLGSNRQFVQNWKVEDFSEDLSQSLAAANPEIGAKLFTEATCAACHQVDCVGGKIGPDLTEVFDRLKNDTAAVVREIVDPSKVIEKKYAMKTIIDIDGKVMSGIVVEEDDDSITLVTNPDAPEPKRILRDDIDDEEDSKVSMMPKGLLDRFTRDEIIEILGYLKHAGDKAKEQN